MSKKSALKAAKGKSKPPEKPRPPRRSLKLWIFGIAALVAIVVVVILAFKPPVPIADKAEPTLAKDILPAIPFVDITQQAGIRFVHNNGAAGEKLLPETMGGGCAFFDYDNDHKPDLLLINSASWPGAAERSSTMKLYHNNGDGTFKDVTAGSGLDVSYYGMGVAVGDYDNDGLVDVFISALGGNHLYRNLGNGKFQEVTTTAGVGGDGSWSASAAFIDVDNDGRLDLFVCNYVQWSKDKDANQAFRIPGVGRAYGPPLAFAGTYCFLFHNNGDGTFTDISEKAGVRVKDAKGRPAAKSLAVAPIDIDGDGFIDLIVANDTVPNFLFHNKRDGTFEEIGARSGLAVNSSGEARGAMGIDAGYFRNDDAMGVAVGNFAEELNALYVSHGPAADMTFTDDATSTGVGPPTHHVLTFGLFFFDADLDGRLDLFMGNGHIEPEIDRLETPQRYRQPAIFLWNRGPASARRPDFLPLSSKECGADLFKPLVARGAAYADIDGDGDLDLIVTQLAGPPLLLRNDQKLGHHWLRLKLVGDPTQRTNRDAIGAWVQVQIGSQRIRRQVMPTRSYLSQVELPITIGLGDRDRVDRVTVLWPNGARQEVSHPKIDGLTEIGQAPAAAH